MSDRIVERARQLLGVEFRAQGRSPDRGVDCIGVVVIACRLPPDCGRGDYRLRGDHRREIEIIVERYFRPVGTGRRRAGDLLLMRVRDDQWHLGIATDIGVVHADARLRKVVEWPGQPPFDVIATYRRRMRPTMRN